MRHKQRHRILSIQQDCTRRRKSQCDVMVIGSRGLGRVKRVTMDETGTAVRLKAPRPVIVEH
jgi:nucleotide-binding universal stress UspA family protein